MQYDYLFSQHHRSWIIILQEEGEPTCTFVKVWRGKRRAAEVEADRLNNEEKTNENTQENTQESS